MLLMLASVHLYVIHDVIYSGFHFFSSGDLLRCLHRKVVCGGPWLFT